MKAKFIIRLFLIIVPFLLVSCDDDEPTEKKIVMDIVVTDTLGNELESYPLSIENLKADTLLRSPKMLHKSGDSIVLTSDIFHFMFNITTNASWKLSKHKSWGSNASITWLANPMPTYGGGNSTTKTSVKQNTQKNDRRAYVYIMTGDSSCVKKYVFLQKGNY